MHCLNLLGNNLECFTDVDFEYQYTMQNLALSALALKKYKYVEELLLNKSRVYINECFCLLVSEYKINKHTYKECFDYYYENNKEDVFKLIDNNPFYL